MTKQTAMLLQIATADGDSRQQMVVFPDRAVFRRSLSGSTRTRWRYASVGDLTTWVPGYINLTASAPEPMALSHGPTLMEVTEDEAAKAATGDFERNVGLRFARVMDSGDVPTDPNVADFIGAWLTAHTDGDDGWLGDHVHPSGTARPGPDPTPTAAPALPEPEEVTPVPASPWTYPPIKAGYVTRPNGERYKVRKSAGVIDVVLLQDSRTYREHVFLTGEPGTGKTALIDAAFGSDLVTMLGTEDVEVSDFIGAYGPRGGGAFGWTDGALVEAMERGVPLFIDEVGVIAPKVMTTLFSVMDGRDEIRVTANPDRGIVKAAPGFFVLAATNPHAPGVRLSEALLSRFALHMEVGTDYAMARELGCPDVLVTAAENLNVRRASGEVGWAPQMRELLRAKAQWTQRSEEIAIRNLIAVAPEDDREVVAEVLKRTTGKAYAGLAL